MLLPAEKTTTNMSRNSEIEDDPFRDIQRIFSKRDEDKKAEADAKMAEARILARKRKELMKKRKIASIFSWSNVIISGAAVYYLILKWLSKLVSQSQFFGWCIIAAILFTGIFVLVGEYIELRIWDKDYE